MMEEPADDHCASVGPPRDSGKDSRPDVREPPEQQVKVLITSEHG